MAHSEEVMRLADEARDSLGTYCMTVCKARCCKRGGLLLQNQEEVDKVNPERTHKVRRLQSGMYSMELGEGCSRLKEEVKCSIYKERPRVCRDYPVFLVKKFLILDDACPAVKEGKLDAYAEKIKQHGYSRP